jgi:hypothetical protein
MSGPHQVTSWLLGADDSPVFTRDIGKEEIYVLAVAEAMS